MIVSARDSSGHYRMYRTQFHGLSDTPQGKQSIGETVSIESVLPKLPADATFIGLSDTAQGTVVSMPDGSSVASLVIFGVALAGLWWAFSQR